MNISNNTIQKKSFFNTHLNVLICILLITTTLAVYWQVRNHEFVFDDGLYITENSYVLNGFSKDNILWTFNFDKRGTYFHPLSWFSHMLDCEIFGPDPGMHHLSNLFFHLLNVLLLFFVFQRMTRSLWRSAFIAGLFALHPINVDSVAWIAERKNLLSTFFLILTMLSYTYYSERRSFITYLLTLFLFTLGLLAKPMLVTLPFAFLLLDYWPLKRIVFEVEANSKQIRKNTTSHLIFNVRNSTVFHLVFEKLPFLAFSAFSIILSHFSLEQSSQIISAGSVPMRLRIANAIVSYIKYIGKMVWPFDFAVYYPYPTSMLPLWQILGAFILLIFISVFAVNGWKRRPYLLVGWLWYLGTLVPVSGIVMGGLWPAMADRWAYVPLIGIYIMVSWGIADLLPQWRCRKVVLSLSAFLILVSFAITTLHQLTYWKNDYTLFKHALDVTKNNAEMHNGIGFYLARNNRIDEAIFHYNEALIIDPNNFKVHTNLAVSLAELGRTDEAIKHYSIALEINPTLDKAHNNYGLLLARKGRIEDAEYHYKEALRINSNLAGARGNLGNLYLDRGIYNKAIEHYFLELRTNNDNPKTHYNLAIAFLKKGNISEAINHFKEATRLDPEYYEAYSNLALAFSKHGKHDRAISYYKKSLEINPNNAKVYYNIGMSLMLKNNIEEAVNNLNKALQLNPEYVEAHNNLGAILTQRGRFDEAIAHYRKALSVDPDYAEVERNLNTTLAKREKFKDAESRLQDALASQPDDPALLWNLGELYKNIGRTERAINSYEKVLSFAPEDMKALHSLATVYATEGDYDNALLSLQKMHALRPQNPDISYNIACMYSRQGKVNESVEWLKNAIDKGFNNWELLKADKDLENIRDTEHYKELLFRNKGTDT